MCVLSLTYNFMSSHLKLIWKWKEFNMYAYKDGKNASEKINKVLSHLHFIRIRGKKKKKYYIQLDYFRHVSESVSGNFFPMNSVVMIWLKKSFCSLCNYSIIIFPMICLSKFVDIFHSLCCQQQDGHEYFKIIIVGFYCP